MRTTLNLENGLSFNISIDIRQRKGFGSWIALRVDIYNSEAYGYVGQ